jgi:hypothetical protein
MELNPALCNILEGCGLARLVGRGDTIKMTKSDFLKEHKNLVRILTKGTKKQRMKEAQEQIQEAHNYGLNSILGGGNVWTDAVKDWNSAQFFHRDLYAVPKKASYAYDEVVEIMNDLKKKSKKTNDQYDITTETIQSNLKKVKQILTHTDEWFDTKNPDTRRMLYEKMYFYDDPKNQNKGTLKEAIDYFKANISTLGKKVLRGYKAFVSKKKLPSAWIA